MKKFVAMALSAAVAGVLCVSCSDDVECGESTGTAKNATECGQMNKDQGYPTPGTWYRDTKECKCTC